MPPLLIITRGLPGSGKTYWALEWVTHTPRRCRINRDDLRWALFREYPPLPREREDLISAVQQSAVRMALLEGWSVCCDDTNLDDDSVDVLRAQARGIARFTVKDLRDVPLGVVLRHNARRTDTPAFVEPEVILAMAEKYGIQ